MSAQAEAQIGFTVPVFEIVATLVSGSREVADLVMAKSRLTGHSNRVQIQIRGHGVLRDNDPLRLHLFLQDRTRLEVEHVQGKMAGPRLQRVVEGPRE